LTINPLVSEKAVMMIERENALTFVTEKNTKMMKIFI
jgi:ribosomal protein L23